MAAGRPLAVRHGGHWRLAPALALALALGVAAGLQMIAPERDAFIATQRLAAGSLFTAGDVQSVLLALKALSLWLTVQIAPFVLIIGLFAMIEVALVGPPRDWRRTGFAFVAFGLSLAIMAVFEPAVHAVWPGEIGPLLTLGAEDVPPALAFATAPLLALLWLIAFDFFQYWVHRAQHAVPALWRYHAVHHSHEAMDSVNAFSHPIDALGVLAGILAFGMLVDFAFEPILYFSAFLSIRDRLLHTRAPIHFGPLHPVLIDNRHHFLHHHPDPAFHNCNFGNSLTLWDRLYGTYRAPTSDMLGRTGLSDLAPVASISGYLRADLPARQPTLIRP